MPTLSDMIDEVKVNLQGYTLRQDRITYVANAGGLQCWSFAVTVNEYDTSDAEPIGGVQQNSYSFSRNFGSTTLNVAPGTPAFHLAITVSGTV